MDEPDPALPEHDWPRALARGTALAADYLAGLAPGAVGVLYGLATEQEVHGFAGSREQALAHLAAMLGTYAEREVVRVWLGSSGTGVEHRTIGRAAEVRVHTRGWDPEVGPLQYRLAHASPWATTADIEHPSLTLRRAGTAPSWEITFIETIFDDDGEVGTTVDLGLSSASFAALTDLPASFWSAVQSAETLEQVITAVHRLGARDTTADARPSWMFGPAAAPDPGEVERARDLRSRFWSVIAEAHLATRDEPDSDRAPGS
ncbi:hypothetical protein [Nocardia asteroides]|uniref:hypothetical protein n=1 Tax=Nocardia asteroides TaxID=1824 RepID=UPI001E6084E7|nr:hypothetical protein [Nocardia asteroides]UGT61894.1 hypothetical protein LTT61_00615 [Nocardia asteroides]